MAYAACASARTGFIDPLKAVQYLEALMRSIFSDQAYRARHESTPIACRSEALAEILLLHRDLEIAREKLPTALMEKARDTLAENLSLQLRFYASGQFRKGRESDKVQIDYVQHNGAAFLAWSQLAMPTPFAAR
jgi:siderophore synthetase component